MNTASTQLLRELGFAIDQDGPHIVDQTAALGHIHHSRVPVALVGYALTMPVAMRELAARKFFPKATFIHLLQKASCLDTPEKAALAALCGALEPRKWYDSEAFGRQVWEVVERYDLGAFFERIERPYGAGGDHYFMRPRGIDYRTSDPIPADLKKWQTAYRAATPLRQLMTATVLQLYKQGPDKHWMVRVKKDWHAMEAIEILRAEAALEDWGRLYALYSGW